MDRSSSRRFLYTFVKVFIVLFVILLILPLIVDHIVDFYSGGIAPKNNSIIVFKDMVSEQEVINRFINTVIKIICFM